MSATTPDEAGAACAVCVRRKPSAATWRYVGESCSHVDCPNRRPVTAAPSSRGLGYCDTPHPVDEEGPWTR